MYAQLKKIKEFNSESPEIFLATSSDTFQFFTAFGWSFILILSQIVYNSLTTPSFSVCVYIDQVILKLPLPFPPSFFFSQVFPLILLLLNHKISEEKWQKGIATFWNYFLGNSLFMFCKCLLNVLYSWSSNM